MDEGKSFVLANGVEMPAVGFGTFQLVSHEATACVAQAIETGYRQIDTAASYGNETAVARGVLESGVPREQLFITGKLWNTKRGYDNALAAFAQSLKRLKLEYLDLYLIHWPASPALHPDWREVNRDTWRALEKLYREGAVRAIGVCNYLPHHLDVLAEETELVPMVNQAELHPGQPQNALRDYAREKGMRLQAWSPLGEGKMLQNETLCGIGEKYGKSAAQVCIRWCLQLGVSPQPKSANVARMAQNLEVFDFALSDEDMETITGMPYFGGSGYDPDTITKFG